MEFLISAAHEAGPLIGIFLFFVWRDYTRERYLLKQVSSLNRYQRRGFEKLIRRSNTVHLKTINALKKSNDTSNKTIFVLKKVLKLVKTLQGNNQGKNDECIEKFH